MKETGNMWYTVFFNENATMLISHFKTPEQYEEVQFWLPVLHWVSKEAGSPDFMVNNSAFTVLNIVTQHMTAEDKNQFNEFRC